MAGLKPGSTLIEMSTIDPLTSREVAAKLEERGGHMLDAPVARGVPAAVAGTLSIFVGGKKKVYEECLDILKAMGPDIFHVGEVLFEALGAGSAGSFARQNQIGQFVLKGLFPEGRFSVDYMMKDLGLALETAKGLHVPLPFTALAMQVYESARAAGKSKKYYPVVITQWEDLTGVKVRE